MTSSSQDENGVCASPAQPPGYKEILNCDNPEDFANHLKGVRAHFDNVRQLYLKFMNEMGDPQFKERILAEIEAQKKNNLEFTEKQKQLKAEVDHLTRNSLTLVKSKFRELGVSSNSHLEFIEKAKNIMWQHHELQKDKGTSKETE